MLKINLRQLEAFAATAEYRSFTKAAEALYLTQSTVSSHISTLEQILDVRLFQRGARQRVLLTEEGERVYREAKEILKQCQALQDMGGQSVENQLVLGASSVPGQCLMPELMASFLARYPDSRYVLLRGDSLRIHRLLDQGKCRIGFVGTAVNGQIYHYHAVAEDRLVVITANTPAYRALQEGGLSGQALLDRPIILREESSGTRRAMDAYLARCGMGEGDLRIVAQIDNPEAIRSSVSRGLGISVVSRWTVQKEVEAGRLLAFDLDPGGIFRTIYMTWRKDAVLSSIEQRFIRFVQGRKVAALDP
ncbi:MAG: LysR family transcriptional regulator [Oscillospiraceae bacterium]|nr:LysR family transcriptional regulator [Oscillospiraceae bacterium]